MVWTKERANEYLKKWRSQHPERAEAIRRRYYSKYREELNQKARVWRENNRDRTHLYGKRRDARLKMLVLSHYSGNPPRCQCCGENTFEFLSIDHVNGDGGEQHRKQLQELIGYRGRTPLYRWLRDSAFPDGYQVLCYNCNCAKGRLGYCPHKNPEKHQQLLELTESATS